MEFEWSDEEQSLRAELRAFLDEELPADWDLNTPGEDPSSVFTREMAGKLADRGWLTPHWPAEYGGRDASAWAFVIVAEELWAVGEPRGSQYMNVSWIGPAIMAAGTEAQKQEHLGPIARGDVHWCQGFSEPGAGSDLASLQTAAARDGDHYVVNGEKIWTSYARQADYCFLLVRTDPTSQGARGISILLVPMDLPGITVEVVPTMLEIHVVHRITFRDVRVPVSCRLGDEHEGWGLIREALAYERVGAPRFARGAYVLDRLAEWASDQGLLDDPEVAGRFGRARAACQAARILTYRVMDDRAKGRPNTPTPYVARVAIVRGERAVAELGMDLMGSEGLLRRSRADSHVRTAMIAGLGGGSYEVQLNLIARLCLGMKTGA
jgi:alkylation response protein AidB-like acyl-CoA dehydrogenase